MVTLLDRSYDFLLVSNNNEVHLLFCLWAVCWKLHTQHV